jgi:hypothetical protein
MEGRVWSVEITIYALPVAIWIGGEWIGNWLIDLEE